MSDPELEANRAMVRAGVASLGLGRVAEQVGMSPSGLRQYMGGTNPLLATREKVRAWCRRHVQGDRRTRREVLVDELVADQPPSQRAALRRTILSLLVDDEAAGAPRPKAGSIQVRVEFRT